MGQVDSSISFTAQPFFPVETLKLKNAFDPTQTLDQERKTKFDGIHPIWGNLGLIQLLPFTWQQQYNTRHLAYTVHRLPGRIPKGSGCGLYTCYCYYHQFHRQQHV